MFDEEEMNGEIDNVIRKHADIDSDGEVPVLLSLELVLHVWYNLIGYGSLPHARLSSVSSWRGQLVHSITSILHHRGNTVLTSLIHTSLNRPLFLSCNHVPSLPLFGHSPTPPT